jgi:hypothetical protein
MSAIAVLKYISVTACPLLRVGRDEYGAMYHLISEHERIQDTVRIWRERMAADAEGNMVLPDHSIWGHINHQPRITEGRSNRFLSHFRVQVAADPHAVEINIPSDGINEMTPGEDGSFARAG